MPDQVWTLDELVRRVAAALTAHDVRAPNGRVRGLPDARAIRWYTTIGLVDRPLGFRGRTALYGPRHLLQAVAVKRRQSEGLPLAAIQAELAGATDATLRRIARLPEPAPAVESPAGEYVAVPPSHHAPPPSSPPSHHAPPPSHHAPPPSHHAPGAPPSPDVAAPDGSRDRFWRARPSLARPALVPAPAPAAPAPTGPVTPAAPAPASPSASPSVVPEAAAPAVAGAELRYRVALPSGVALDLPAPPTPADLADITAAAGPLIRLLAARGLLTPDQTPEEPSDDRD